MRDLTPKQQAFVREYLVDLNATQAAIRAGYSSKDVRTASAIGLENLEKPRIAEAIRIEMDARAQKTDITAERVLQEIANIAFANAGDFFEWGAKGVTVRDSMQLTEAQRSVVSEVSETITEAGGTIRIKLADKSAALDKLCRHLGMYNDKVKFDPEIVVNIVRFDDDPGDTSQPPEGSDDE